MLTSLGLLAACIYGVFFHYTSIMHPRNRTDMVIFIGNINLQNHLLSGETNPSPKDELLRIIIAAPMENNPYLKTQTNQAYLADPKLQASHHIFPMKQIAISWWFQA